MRNNLHSVIVSAPSGAGKSSLIRALLKTEQGLEFSISTTTRRPRPTEVDGVHYYFVSDEVFDGMTARDEFLEWALVHQNRYGTAKKEVDRIHCMGKIPIFDVDVQGARSLKACIEGGVFIFVIPPSPLILQKRLRNRQTESEEALRVRIRNMAVELQEYRNFDYLIVNDDFDRAVADFKSVLRAERCRTGRMESFIREWEDACDNSFGKADSV